MESVNGANNLNQPDFYNRIKKNEREEKMESVNGANNLNQPDFYNQQYEKQESEEDNSSSIFQAGVAAAAATGIGATIGLLYALRKGKTKEAEKIFDLSVKPNTQNVVNDAGTIFNAQKKNLLEAPKKNEDSPFLLTSETATNTMSKKDLKKTAIQNYNKFINSFKRSEDGKTYFDGKTVLSADEYYEQYDNLLKALHNKTY